MILGFRFGFCLLALSATLAPILNGCASRNAPVTTSNAANHGAASSQPTPGWTTFERSPLAGIKTVLFLGDDIVADGRFVVDFQVYCAVNRQQDIQCINLGRPAERVSRLCLNKPGGPEVPAMLRLEKEVAAILPDMVVVCWGLNDGLIDPLDEAGFDRFCAGTTRLHEYLVHAKVRTIILTPPAVEKGFTEWPFRRTVKRYAQWLREQRAAGWEVVDIETAMRGQPLHSPPRRTLRRRRTSPRRNPAGR